MKALHVISWLLLVIGGLNWLLVGLGGVDWNIVEKVLGAGSNLTKIVYVLIGLSALVSIFTHKRDCKCCVSSGAPSSM